MLTMKFLGIATSTVLFCCQMESALLFRLLSSSFWEASPVGNISLLTVFWILIGVDFGSWRPNILIVLSLLAWGIGFGWLGVHDPSKWQAGIGLYIVGRKKPHYSLLKK